MIISKKTLYKAVSTVLLAGTVSFQAQAQHLDRIIAIVNEDIILESELNQRERLFTEQILSRGVQVPDQSVLRQQVTERLILDSIQLQLAEIQGIRVSDRQLNEALENIAAQNNMSLTEFSAALEAEGENYADVREQIRREILISQVQQTNVNRRIQVSEQEIRNFINSEMADGQDQAEFHLSNILIALPSQASPDMIQAAEAKAESVYNQLMAGAEFADLAVSTSNAPNALSGGELGWRKQSELPESLAASLAGISPGEFTRPIRTSGGFHILRVNDQRGGEVTLVEQTQVSHILIAPNEIRTPEQARILVHDLRHRMREGQPFDDLARRYSDDPGSGSQGGDLGWAQEGQMVPEFEQVMKTTPVGQTSDPFESRFGWHILHVRDRRTQDMSAEMMENFARITIRQRKFNEELDNWLRELRSEAYVELKQPTQG